MASPLLYLIHSLTGVYQLKTFKFALFALIFISFAGYANDVIDVSSKVIDIGQVTETLGNSTKRLVLRLSPASPEEFKVKFSYKYKFVSRELDSVIIGPGGIGGYTTRTNVEYYEGNETIRFDIAESTVPQGELLELVVDISKPNKNIHGIKVVVSLSEGKGNSVEGGKKLLGLLGRSYEVKADCP